MRTKIMVEHSDNCCYLTNPENLKHHMTPWAVIDDKKPYEFLDAIGRKGGWRMWIRFRCNDTSCGAIIAVLSHEILDNLPTGLPAPSKHRDR